MSWMYHYTTENVNDRSTTLVLYNDENPCSPTATAERRQRWIARMKERIAQAEQRSQLHEAKCLRADLRRG